MQNGPVDRNGSAEKVANDQGHPGRGSHKFADIEMVAETADR